MDSIRIMHMVAGEAIGETIMDGTVLQLIIQVFMPVDIQTIIGEHLPLEDLK